MDPEILSKKIRSENMSELGESQFEKNQADQEDQFTDLGSDIQKDDDEDSVSLGFDDDEAQELLFYNRKEMKTYKDTDTIAGTRIKKYNEEYDLFEGGGYGKGKPLNNSFTGPYNNMDHIHKDRGANTQFE